MRTTIIKVSKLHIWVSGSVMDPFANLYYDSKKAKCGYEGINWKYVRGCNGKLYRRNPTPKFLRWFLEAKTDWNDWYFHNCPDPEEAVVPVRPNFLKFLAKCIYVSYKRAYCKHSNLEHEETGCSEYGPSGMFFCPDCGFSMTYDHL